jgi:hypothetical protein
MLIIIISYIINLLAPIVNTLGIFGLILSIGNDDIDVLIISGVLAIVGLIFGIFAYSNSIPPRWFWSRSKDFIFEFSVTAVLGYAWNFATWPLAIYIIRLVVEEL